VASGSCAYRSICAESTCLARHSGRGKPPRNEAGPIGRLAAGLPSPLAVLVARADLVGVGKQPFELLVYRLGLSLHHGNKCGKLLVRVTTD
jgi:hypothetical protein